MPTREYWESAYESGEFKHWETEDPSPELAALAAAGFFHKGSTVLDAGTGGGNDAIFLAKLGFKVTGIDWSLAALEIAKKRAGDAGVTVDFRVGSVLDIPLADGTIDFVTDRGLFHLLDDIDERPQYAAELFRVLKTGGRVLIRGAGGEAAKDRYNPVSEEAVDRFFTAGKFKRGPVVPVPLYSPAGVLEARMVILEKTRPVKPGR